MILVGIAGPTAGGKTQAAQTICDARAAYCNRYSSILAEIARKKGLSADKSTLQKLSTILRKEKGENHLTKKMRRKLLATTQRTRVVEGNRRLADMEFLVSFAEEHDAELVLIYVDASPKTRLTRLNERQEKLGQTPTTREEFEALESDECENELPKIRSLVQKQGHIIENNTATVEELKKHILT